MKRILSYIMAAAVLAALSVIAAADTGDAVSGITQGQLVLGGVCTVFVTGAVVMAVLALRGSTRRRDGSTWGKKK